MTLPQLLSATSTRVLHAGVLAAAFSAGPLLAQAQTTPAVTKASSTNSQSYYLFSDPVSRKTQLLYPPASLRGPVAPGAIRRVYFMYGDFGSGPTFTDLVITLGQTSNTTFAPANAFYTGQDTVLHHVTETIPYGQSAGNWFSFGLDQPFTYDPTQTLIVTVSWGNTNGTSFTTSGDPTNAPNTMGKKLYADNVSATTGITTSAVWQHFGFNLGPLGLVADAAADDAWTVFPNPATDAATVTLAAPTALATLTLTDVLGRTVRHYAATPAELRAGQPLNLRDLPAGPYALTVEQAGHRTTRRLVVR